MNFIIHFENLWGIAFINIFVIILYNFTNKDYFPKIYTLVITNCFVKTYLSWCMVFRRKLHDKHAITTLSAL